MEKELDAVNCSASVVMASSQGPARVVVKNVCQQVSAVVLGAKASEEESLRFSDCGSDRTRAEEDDLDDNTAVTTDLDTSQRARDHLPPRPPYFSAESFTGYILGFSFFPPFPREGTALHIN